MNHLTKKSAMCSMVLAVGATAANATVINVSNPANVLQPSNALNASPPLGETVTTSYPGLNFGPFTGNPDTIVDNAAIDNTNDGDFLFNTAPSVANPDSVAITGFSAPSGFNTVRIFLAPADTQRVPASITLYSSTTNTSGSLNTADYTSLGTFSDSSFVYHPYAPDDPTGQQRGYFDLPVSAPAGTQSLLLVVPLDQGGNAGLRLYEVQALTPEPASAGILSIGALALLARRRVF